MVESIQRENVHKKFVDQEKEPLLDRFEELLQKVNKQWDEAKEEGYHSRQASITLVEVDGNVDILWNIWGTRKENDAEIKARQDIEQLLEEKEKNRALARVESIMKANDIKVEDLSGWSFAINQEESEEKDLTSDEE